MDSNYSQPVHLLITPINIVLVQTLYTISEKNRFNLKMQVSHVRDFVNSNYSQPVHLLITTININLVLVQTLFTISEKNHV